MVWQYVRFFFDFKIVILDPEQTSGFVLYAKDCFICELFQHICVYAG